MRRIKVGIIGQGRSGRNIHRHLLETLEPLRERYEVVAVADYIPERCNLEDVTPADGFRSYSDYRRLLADPAIELIVNATLSRDHVPVGIEALESGHDVLCEKPLAGTVAEVDAIMGVARRAGRRLAVFQQSRFRPIFRKALEVMRSGILGRPVLVRIAYNGFSRRWDWQTLQEFGGGELMNTGPHPLDQALQFFGDADPETVFCRMDRANSFGNAEDQVKLLLAGAGHPTIDLEVSRCCAFPGAIYEIRGTCGGLRADAAEMVWKYFIPDEAPEQRLIATPLEGPGRLPVYCVEKLHFHERKWEVPPMAESVDSWGCDFYINLYCHLTAGAPLEVTLEQVRRQVRIIEECHRQNPLPRDPVFRPVPVELPGRRG